MIKPINLKCGYRIAIRNTIGKPLSGRNVAVSAKKSADSLLDQDMTMESDIQVQQVQMKIKQEKRQKGIELFRNALTAEVKMREEANRRAQKEQRRLKREQRMQEESWLTAAELQQVLAILTCSGAVFVALLVANVAEPELIKIGHQLLTAPVDVETKDLLAVAISLLVGVSVFSVGWTVQRVTTRALDKKSGRIASGFVCLCTLAVAIKVMGDLHMF